MRKKPAPDPPTGTGPFCRRPHLGPRFSATQISCWACGAANRAPRGFPPSRASGDRCLYGNLIYKQGALVSTDHRLEA